MFCDQELAILDAIHADPKNDEVRLAYANWLEGRGESEHAEFIRLQCQQPYVAISNRNPSQPRLSYDYDFPDHDPGARDRLGRILELLPRVYRSDRYAIQRGLPYYEVHYRGMPQIHVGDEDETRMPDWALANMGPLSRVELTARTNQLPELLAHPIMPRVDKLHLWPGVDWDQVDADGTINSHYDRFWSENIRVLAANPNLERLLELRLCGCHSTGPLTEQSLKNLSLSKELLEPRVKVEYDY